MANTKMIQEMLTRAIFEVFEKMYYIFSEPVKGHAGNYPLTASINFTGPASGTLRIFLSRGIAEAMARNMLNLEKGEIDLPIMADCVRESLNMICGNFVRKLDSDRVFDLSIPVFEIVPEGDPPDRNPRDHEINLSFAADCGSMRFTVTAPDMA